MAPTQDIFSTLAQHETQLAQHDQMVTPAAQPDIFSQIAANGGKAPETAAPAQPEQAGFGHRFLEGAGLPTEVPKAPQSFKELALMAVAPAVEAYHKAKAPVEHAERLVEAIKKGDGEAAAMHLGNFLDSFIPGTGNAMQLSQETAHDVETGNLAGIGGTATGLATQLALAKGLTKVPGAGEAEAAEGAAKPGIAKEVLKGEKLAQKPAQEALRTGVKAGGKEAGLSTVQNQSLRTVAEEPISKIEEAAKESYQQIDKAAGTDFKALREKLANTEYQIRQLTETEEDVAKEAALEKSRVGILDKIEAAKQQAIKAGVDPKLLEKADSQFKQANALKDLETKVFKNTNVVSGNAAMGTEETVNVDQAVKSLQKLHDNTKFGGSRLEQALGKEGAQALLKQIYDAQKIGAHALKTREIVKTILKASGALGALGTGAGAIARAVRE